MSNNTKDRNRLLCCERDSSSDTEDYLESDDRRRRVFKNRMSYGSSTSPKPCLVQKQNSGARGDSRSNSTNSLKQSLQNNSPRYVNYLMFFFTFCWVINYTTSKFNLGSHLSVICVILYDFIHYFHVNIAYQFKNLLEILGF